MERTIAVSLTLHYEELIRTAIDEGDVSPDVVGFNRDAFWNELMAEIRVKAC